VEESSGDAAEESGADEEADAAGESTGGEEESSFGEPGTTSAAETFGSSTSFGSTTDVGSSTSTTGDDEGTGTTGFESTSISTFPGEDGGVTTTGEETSTSEGAEETTAEPPVLIDYASEIQPIWDTSCTSSSCHGGLFPPNLTATTGAAGLIDQAASTRMPYVTPGSPEDSYIYLKITNDPQ